MIEGLSRGNCLHNVYILSLFICSFDFELSLELGCLALGCVSVRLSLPSPLCLGESATLSLLLPPRSGEEGKGRHEGHRGQHTRAGQEEDAGRALCGPIRLRPLVDVTGCSVQVRGLGGTGEGIGQYG